MRVDIVTIFPELFELPLRTSILGRGVEARLLEVFVHDLREHGLGRHRSVDDTPYGGGAGMVMRPEPIFECVEPLLTPQTRVVLMSPRGSVLTQDKARRLADLPHLVIICGRYEGVDERVAQHLVHEELSIGDYVLSGGELPALVVLESVARLLPGVLGNEESLTTESHTAGLLEHPQYTRPAEYRGLAVPEVLLGGNHGAIAAWREEESRRITRERRPDLLDD